MPYLLMLSLAALLFLPACGSSAHGTHLRQAVAPAPMPVRPPPVMTPGYFPGTPPAPVYTPPGTGLPAPGQPGSQGAAVPRSPNKRVLPASNEPGLWAADGAPRASTGSPTLYGIEIPYPPDAKDEDARARTRACVMSIEQAANSVAELGMMNRAPLASRACMAALSYRHCAQGTRDGFLLLKKNAVIFDEKEIAYHESMLRHAKTIVDKFCKGVKVSRDDAGSMQAVLEEWTRLWIKDLTSGQ